MKERRHKMHICFCCMFIIQFLYKSLVNEIFILTITSFLSSIFDEFKHPTFRKYLPNEKNVFLQKICDKI